MNISFLTTTRYNIGDDFIRDGVKAILEKLGVHYHPFYMHKLAPESRSAALLDETHSVEDKFFDSDLFILSGAPVYWNLNDGRDTSVTSEWSRWFMDECIFSEDSSAPVVLTLGAGSCQPYGDDAQTFVGNAECLEFAKKLGRRSALTVVRDPLAAAIVQEADVAHEALPCPAFLAALTQRDSVADYADENAPIGINLMPFGGHFNMLADFDEKKWEQFCFKLTRELRLRGSIVFVAHNSAELDFMRRFALPSENIFISGCWSEYYAVYSACRLVLANRVHGGICAAGFGIPSIIMGEDTRLLTAEFVGVPHFCVNDVSWEKLVGPIDEMLRNRRVWSEKLIDVRDQALKRYVELLTPVIDSMTVEHCTVSQKGTEDVCSSNRLRISKVSELQSAGYRDFMLRMNTFAKNWELREFTNWSKIWEYPWIWYHALVKRNWKGCWVVDLGSEKSPMPWILSLMGAKVTLIEVDPQWIPLWEKLKGQMGVDVQWHVVGSELIPVEDGTIDLVTSYSVVEHQSNKELAVEEIARVLKPGGCLAISFDICESDLGMTFPDWNGAALTMQEFERIFWQHSAFHDGNQIVWNIEDLQPYWDWHKETASHHNYITAGAVLYKR